MIVKILKPAVGFPGVRYNTNKVDKNKGELLRKGNFGALQGMNGLRPQDYVNYLKMVSAQNKQVRKPQFHAVLSAKGNNYDKNELTRIAVSWLELMGFGAQPYLVVFHKDTENNHVHVVSTRVDRNGKKINSAFEKLRAIDSLNTVLGYNHALQYKFSTVAQFYLVLERAGFEGRDMNQHQLKERIAGHTPDKERAQELKQLLIRHKGRNDMEAFLRSDHCIELVFHAAEGRAPYGYTIIDHETRQVFKGSEVLPLRELISGQPARQVDEPERSEFIQPQHLPGVWIADDVDDEAILGRNRRKKKKARTNTR